MHVWVDVVSHIPVESHIAAAVQGEPTGPAIWHMPPWHQKPGKHEATTDGSHIPIAPACGTHTCIVGSQ